MSEDLERKTRNVRKVKDKNMLFSLWLNAGYLSTRSEFSRASQLTSPGKFNSLSS